MCAVTIFAVGDRVDTPDGPGEIIGIATMEYIPIGPRSTGIGHRSYIWGTPVIAVDGPYVVRLERAVILSAVRRRQNELHGSPRVRGYLFDQLKPR